MIVNGWCADMLSDMHKFLLKQCDAFYISYDEPNAEHNWQRIKDILPHAKRVHKVRGFETAHKTCAMATASRRFITIDGDNYVDEKIFDHELDDSGHPDVVFSFKSKNIINGLEYGNGGIKCWNAKSLLASKTHESSDDTDFCWALRYYQVDKIGSMSINNASPFQAWRAGYREGVKMSYVNGKPVIDPSAVMSKVPEGNRSKLNIWMTIGRDAENGIWAMLGARQGFYDIYTGEICNSQINDYDWFRDKWSNMSVIDPDTAAKDYANRLRNLWNIQLPELDHATSAWFKTIYLNPSRSGMML